MPRNLQKRDVAGNTALHLAAQEGHLEAIGYLLSEGSDSTIQNSNGDTALHLAAGNSHFEIVEALLNHGADHTIKNDEEETALDCLLKKQTPKQLLNLAIQKGLLKLAELSNGIIRGSALHSILKDYYHDVNQLTGDERLIGEHTENAFEKNSDFFVQNDLTDPIMQRPLLEPVKLISTVDGLKSQRAFENDTIREWFKRSLTNPLNRESVEEEVVPDKYVKQKIRKKLLECFNEYLETLKTEEKEKINDTMDNVMYIVLNKELIKELEKGDFYLNWNLIRQYLNDGANINILNRNGDSLLQIAAVYQSLESVRFLVDNGANINHQGSCYYTALHEAIKKGRVDIVKYFLSLKNIDLKLKNTEGLTPLDCLLKKQTPQELLNLAIEVGLLKLAELSIDAGADVNNTLHGMSLLQYSTQRGNFEIVKHLLKNGACVNYQDSFRGNTAMHEAASNGSLNIVKLLLEYGADTEVADKRGDKPIHTAVQNGCTNIVEILLKVKGIKLDPKNDEGQTPLHIAIGKRYGKIAELLIGAGADITAKGKNGKTPLQLAEEGSGAYIVDILRNKTMLQAELLAAAERGNSGDVNKAIELGADVNYQGSCKDTALHKAAKAYNTHIVEILLKVKGIKLDLENDEGKTPLHIAIEKGYGKMAKLLIDAGANINILYRNGDSLLQKAAGDASSELVKYLLSKEVYVNHQGSCKDTALHKAAKAYNTHIVEILLKVKGIKLDLENDEGKTPLHIAIEKGYGKMAKLLIDAGANINAQDNYGYTPLLVAANNGFENIVKLLIESGADVNARAKNSYTPILIAASKGYENIVKLLTDKKEIDVNAKTNSGNTPLFLAALYGYENIVKLLINKGADVNVEVSSQWARWTPLLFATHKGYKNVAKLLIEGGANVNAQDKDSNTSLHYAARNGSLEIVKLLLEHGADVHVVNNEMLTPLHLAVRNGHTEAAQLIIEHILAQNFNATKPDFLNLILSNHWDKCITEIDKMKGYAIGNISKKEISLYDFFAESDLNKLASYMSDKGILATLNTNDYKEKFFIYASKIEDQYQKGMERKCVLSSAIDYYSVVLLSSIIPVVKKEFNRCILQEIFQYAGNELLRQIVPQQLSEVRVEEWDSARNLI